MPLLNKNMNKSIFLSKNPSFIGPDSLQSYCCFSVQHWKTASLADGLQGAQLMLPQQNNSSFFFHRGVKSLFGTKKQARKALWVKLRGLVIGKTLVIISE